MQSMVICCFWLFILFYIFYNFQYDAYDSHKKTFKIVFKLELKAYDDNITILICCNNVVFIKCFFFVFERVLSLLDGC